MKRIIILYLVLLAFACSKQKENNIQNKDSITEVVTIIKNGKKTMEKFDIQKYNENRINGKTDENGEFVLILDNGTKIIQGGDGDDESIEKIDRTYYEKIQKKNNPIILQKYYSYTGNLVSKGEQFGSNGFMKGIWSEYNEQGFLVKETDYDAPYKNFPWEKVKEYCENRNINLMTFRTLVYRGEVWLIKYSLNENEKYHDKMYDTDTNVNIELNAKTGRVEKEYLTFWEESNFIHLAKDNIGDGIKGLIIINNPQNKEQSILEIEENNTKQTENIMIAIIIGVTVLMASIILYFKFLKK